ncbi:hypothetical protein CNMCM5793_007992 [Aspergillus hiratsukae]|uniref:Uncharacterized protein n=1 Tax=Aspergillus hiratsukae TaxID=1194566 RepID=A0A8H6PQG5_9EURO|nr:hypothetical protein CNMCM5793_007992 [Aspergillus hiratsukae]KAF7158512.1 hypothetical protein CNMCM6106_005106 [Aspergillus hiratsukae]
MAKVGRTGHPLTMPFHSKQRLIWRTDMGWGGVLIWAIDPDDDSRRALQGVTGKDVPPAPSVVDGFGAFSLDQCYITDCNRECQAGDVKMTTLNSDKSGRGCNRKKGEVRSFCCPAMNAPDASTCHWSSDSTDCRGQCGVGEVTMLEDDYGNRCCPATNGQKAIAACEYSPTNKPCPNDKPQELTPIAEWAGSRRRLDDNNGISALVKDNRGNYDKPYIPQGLADLWRTWVEQEHDRVQHEVKAWLEKWVKLAYDRNRPADDNQHLSEGQSVQKNPNIVKIFETAWAEVQNLRGWDINWDFDAMDTDA